MWSPKKVNEFVEATERALDSLREVLGKWEFEELRIHRKELRLYCKVKNLDGEYKFVVKYNGKDVWVEGPKEVAILVKNRVKRFLR